MYIWHCKNIQVAIAFFTFIFSLCMFCGFSHTPSLQQSSILWDRRCWLCCTYASLISVINSMPKSHEMLTFVSKKMLIKPWCHKAWLSSSFGFATWQPIITALRFGSIVSCLFLYKRQNLMRPCAQFALHLCLFANVGYLHCKKKSTSKHLFFFCVLQLVTNNK